MVRAALRACVSRTTRAFSKAPYLSELDASPSSWSALLVSFGSWCGVSRCERKRPVAMDLGRHGRVMEEASLQMPWCAPLGEPVSGWSVDIIECAALRDISPAVDSTTMQSSSSTSEPGIDGRNAPANLPPQQGSACQCHGCGPLAAVFARARALSCDPPRSSYSGFIKRVLLDI